MVLRSRTIKMTLRCMDSEDQILKMKNQSTDFIHWTVLNSCKSLYMKRPWSTLHRSEPFFTENGRPFSSSKRTETKSRGPLNSWLSTSQGASYINLTLFLLVVFSIYYRVLHCKKCIESPMRSVLWTYCMLLFRVPGG